MTLVECTATDMTGMFKDVTDFSTIGDITGWNTSCVTNMNSMFLRSSFNQDISKWDTHNVVDMGLMFGAAEFFNQPIGSWNTSSVTNMWSMFWNAFAFDQNISSWNINSVTDMDGMFDGVTISTTNYDALLNGWSSESVPDGIIFNGGNSKYSTEGQTGRDILTNTHGWNIIDGGMLDSIPPIGTSNIADGMFFNTANVDASVHCSDSGSGINESRTYVRMYDTQNNELTPYSGFVYQLIPDGIYHTQYGCADNAGNTFDSIGDNYGNIYFTVDTTPPYLISTAVTNGMFVSDNNIDLTAYGGDDLSGVNHITVYLYDSNNNLLYSNTTNQDTLTDSYLITTNGSTTDGNYYLEYFLVDNAGNTFNSENITFTIDTTNPVVSFCEIYNSNDSGILNYPYDGAIYNENSIVPQTGCVEDTNFEMLYWSTDMGYQASYDINNVNVFQNSVNNTNIYYVNEEIPAPSIFTSGSGQYVLTVSGMDSKGNAGESTKTVIYDDTAPNIYFCDSFGGASPEDGDYLSNNSDFWMDLCVYDLTLNNMTSYTRDENNNTLLQAYDSWNNPDCVSTNCGFAYQYNLTAYNFSDGLYTIEAEATDMAGHTGYSEIRNFYYDTTPPIFLQSNIVNNSVITDLSRSISFQFDDRTVGSMVAFLYDANNTYINQFPISDCVYEGINTSNGYTDRFINSNGINCSISFLNLGILSNGIYTINATYTDGVNLVGQSNTSTFEVNCIENWVPDPLTCIEGSQILSYTDTHNCGTTESLPADNNTIIESNKCYYSNNTIVSDCGNIAESGIYTLNNSIDASNNISLNSSSTCLIIQSDNVTLDCSGYNITGNLRANGFTDITLNNCFIDGAVTAIGNIGEVDNYTGEDGGSIVVYNSTITSIATTGGQSSSIGTGGAGGNVTAYNSNITAITTIGGNGGWEGIGGLGGTVTAYDSNITAITTIGGIGYRHSGGVGGDVLIYNSNITTITTTGGNTQYGGLGGVGGQIIITNSSITPLTIITAIGGNTEGDSGEDGVVTIIDSRIDWDSTINVGQGRLILNESYFNNEFGEIKFYYLNTTQTEFNSIISINNNSAYIDSANYSEYNIPATVTLNLKGWNIITPSIKRDGIVCTNCSIQNYDSDSGIITFDVQGWSNYTITEADIAPSSAQGSSTGSGTGSSAGGGGSGVGGNVKGNNISTLCIESWKCSAWSSCSTHGLQIRTCSDQNSCGTTTKKPIIVQVCNQNAYDTNIQSPKKALFDIIAAIVMEPKKVGEDLIVKISLINFGLTGTVNANLEYTVSDSNGATVKQYTKIIPVTTQTEFLDNINTSGLMVGKYTLNINLTYKGQEQPASTEKVFYIGQVGLLRDLWRNISLSSIIIAILSIIIVALLVFLYIRKRRAISNKNTESSLKTSTPDSTNTGWQIKKGNESDVHEHIAQNLKVIAMYNKEIQILKEVNQSLEKNGFVESAEKIEKQKEENAIIKFSHKKSSKVDKYKASKLNKYVKEKKKR